MVHWRPHATPPSHRPSLCPPRLSFPQPISSWSTLSSSPLASFPTPPSFSRSHARPKYFLLSCLGNQLERREHQPRMPAASSDSSHRAAHWRLSTTGSTLVNSKPVRRISKAAATSMFRYPGQVCEMRRALPELLGRLDELLDTSSASLEPCDG